MRITFGTTQLVGLAENHQGVTINGEQVVQTVAGIRSAILGVIARGNKSTAFSFGVERNFSTPERAERYRLQHWPSLVQSGTLQCIIGTSSTFELTPAVLRNVSFAAGNEGCSLFTTYTFNGGLFTDGGPPIEFDPLLDVIRAQTIPIPANAVSMAIAFVTPLAGVPHIPAPSVMMASPGGARIWATPVKDTITAAGFSVEFSGAVPAGSFLSYNAIFA